MITRWNVVVRGLLIGALLGAGALVTPAASDGEAPSWCAYMAAPRPAADASKAGVSLLLPRQARYDLELLGNLAHGTLSLEFANPGETDLDLKFHASRPVGIQMQALESAPDPELGYRPLKYENARTGGAKTSRGRKTPVTSGAQNAFGSDGLLLEAEESIWIRVEFTRTLGFGEGRFRLQLPVVGGSCIPGGAAAAAATPLAVTLLVHHGEPLEIAESPSHAILAEFEGDRTVVELVAMDATGQLPFEFDYALGATNEPALSSYVTPEGANGERDVLLVFAPSVSPEDETVRVKELLFVLDTSGSMKGPKIDAVRGALVACLEQLQPEDRFNLIEFDGKFTLLFGEPQPASAGMLGEASAWLQQQEAGGSTVLLPALDAALKQARSEEHHRQVVVLTDGAIGDKDQVLPFLQEHLGEARLFFVGVGAEPNREKVLELAEYARGTAVFADDPAGFAVAVQQLFKGISAPLAWDLRVDWGEAQVLEVEPRRLPDLYTGRPVTLKARVKGELPETLILEATTTSGSRTFEAVLPGGGAREFPQVRTLRPPSEAPSKRKGGR